MAGPLEGMRVLDISEGIAAPFCAKLLGDLGADVVKVEHPDGGDASRALGPFPGGVPEAERSASFFYFNTSKSGVTLDLSSEGGRAKLELLLGAYDVVIAGETDGQLSDIGIGFEQLRAWNERVILTTISGFGSEGPHAGYGWSHLIACAVGGWARTCGLEDREPLQAGGAITETLAGAFAAVATLQAVLGRKGHGHGDHVDVSAQQSTLCGALFPSLSLRTRVMPVASAGASLPRSGRRSRTRFATDDRRRYFRKVWPGACRLASFLPWLKSQRSLRIENAGSLSTLNTPRPAPSRPFKSTVTDAKPYRPPLLGEHNDEVFAELTAPAAAGGAVIRGSVPPALTGLTIVDLSMFFSGPLATQIAGDAGADIIKVESVQRIDGWRAQQPAAWKHPGSGL